MIKTDIKRITILSALALMPLGAMAQNNEHKASDLPLSKRLQERLIQTKSEDTITAFVYFSDKGANIEAKLIEAKSALEPGALQRRIVNRGANNIVSIKDVPVNVEYLNKVSSLASKTRHAIKALNAVSIEATPDAIKQIAQLSFVQKVDLVNRLKRKPAPQDIIKVEKGVAANNSKQSNQLALDYGPSLTQVAQINVPAAHEAGYTGSGIIIAVFDSGFNRLSHESLSQTNIAAVWDFVNNDGDVGDGVDMGTGSHGTNTLSTIGGYSPGNLIGPAYGATYYLAKTENNESELHVEEDNWCAAAEWADTNGAHIITSSLGYTDFDSGTDYTPSDMDGDTTIVTVCADNAAENGIVVVNSAGNSGSGTGENTLGAPSDGHFVLGVGAVTATGSRSSFSSVGPSADGRTKPDVMAMGSSVYVASSTSDSEYNLVNGTSFSCPLTAGVVALLLESDPSLTAAAVRDIMRNTANNASMPNNNYGYGIIDAVAAIGSTGVSFAPVASFNAITNNNETVSFVNTSTDPDGSVESYRWNFGDGNSSTETNPIHTYSSGGNYTVTLEVTDNDGLTNELSKSITVTSPVSSSGGSGSTSIFLILFTAFVARLRKNRVSS